MLRHCAIVVSSGISTLRKSKFGCISMISIADSRSINESGMEGAIWRSKRKELETLYPLPVPAIRLTDCPFNTIGVYRGIMKFGSFIRNENGRASASESH